MSNKPRTRKQLQRDLERYKARKTALADQTKTNNENLALAKLELAALPKEPKKAKAKAAPSQEQVTRGQDEQE